MIMMATQSRICTYKRGGFIKQEKVNYIFLMLKILVILLFIFEFTILLTDAHGTPIEKESLIVTEPKLGGKMELIATSLRLEL